MAKAGMYIANLWKHNEGVVVNGQAHRAYYWDLSLVRNRRIKVSQNRRSVGPCATLESGPRS